MSDRTAFKKTLILYSACKKSHREIIVNVVFINIIHTYLEIEKFDLQLTIFIFKVLSISKLIRINSPVQTQIPSFHELIGC